VQLELAAVDGGEEVLADPTHQDERCGARREEQEREGAAAADRTELAGLRQERKEVLAQVDGIIKELDRLDIQ
jgi:hypothetical protein